MADITLVNLNLLYVRYSDAYDQERHVPLGPLYLTTALERAGLAVDFRDYQLSPATDPFDFEALLAFLEDPAPVIGLSCMANLLPFTLLAAERIRARWPDRRIVLGGVGSKSVEAEILRRFPWIDVVAHGEGERAVAPLVGALRDGRDLADVPGVFYRRPDGSIACNPPPARIDDLASIGRPAWHRVDLGRYDAYGMVTSRGCPYPCTFCSVAPVWDRVFRFRSAEDVVGEMRELHERAGVELFLFQDEFFVSSKRAVHEFCRVLRASGLPVRWKAFARIDLADEALMAAMADAGCIEIRFGVESGSDRMLRRIRKGFTAAQAVEVVAAATRIVPRVDTFFIWGFPDETLDDFHQSLGQMVAFRLMGARILPSLLCLLPQTELYRSLTPEERGRLEFCDELLPEYMITGHEICRIGSVAMAERHRPIFDFVRRHPDLFPGFFLLDPGRTVKPKLELLRQHGFYTRAQRELADLRQTDSCGAHSPRV